MNALIAQLPILPVVLPLTVGALLLLIGRRSPRAAQALGLLSLAAVLGCAIALLIATDDGPVLAYRAGDWPAPFGIALAVDRLSAVMLVVVSVTAIACQLAAADGVASRAPHFAALLQLQVMGLNGAFTTADLFNLFVFFEVLLIASYALLLHGAGREALRASLHYVCVNLLASALFLIAVSLLYGVLGTLNIADLAQRIPAADGAARPFVTAAVLLLIVVFGVKAALLPLGFWLPGTYRAAPLPVAALFAVMTKVGVYAVLRLAATVLAGDAPLLAVASDVVLAGGVATLLASGIWALAAADLRALSCALIASSAGMLLMLVGVGSPAALGAALVYLPHTTFATAALFLAAGLIADARGSDGADRLVVGAAPRSSEVLGVAFLFCAVAIAGLPPLSGFVAKLLILDATRSAEAWPLLWIAVLGTGLVSIVAFARAGSVLFWKSERLPEVALAAGPTAVTAGRGTGAALLLLCAATLAIVVAAAPLAALAGRIGTQLSDPREYLAVVLTAPQAEESTP